MIAGVPFLAAADTLEKAHLRIVQPSVGDPIIPLRFNPTDYQLQKSNNFAEIPIPGLESPPLQYVRGSSEKLSLEVLLDTSDTLENVRTKYVDRLRGLMRINSTLHAPPIVLFVWGDAIFRGVIESISVTYAMFTPQGVPVRAQVALSLTEYQTVEEQVNRDRKGSPDTEKSVTLRRGDTLDRISSGIFNDPRQWREIARANGIRDPRRLQPGQQLLIPRLPEGGANG
ncbi:MAG: LysM peptidoglycan-binding domain-containing protein [Rhodospirillales bacterium]